MKERLNLTVDGTLLEAMKAYAASKEMSVSELVECYFRSVTKPVRGDSILDLLDRLEGPGSGAQIGGNEGEVAAEAAAGNVTYGSNVVYAESAGKAVNAPKEGGGGHGF